MTKILSILLLFTLVFSCKDKTKEENTAVQYQCPMDCEKGKTYTKKDSCPVCKMDLKQLGHSEDCSCSSHSGECKCKDEECTCSTCDTHNSSKHNKKTTCICDDKKDCKCEAGKCECQKCPVHS